MGSILKKADHMNFRVLRLILGASALCQFSVAGAKQITYVFDGTASGTLGGETFSNVDLSATGVTDTADVPPPGVEILFSPMQFTIDIAGIGPTNVATGLLGLYNFPSAQFVDFGWLAPQDDQIGVVEINNPVFATYDMKTSIGPITETGADSFVGNWSGMSTPAGNLTVTSWNDVSFTATVAGGGGGSGNAVPFPNAAWFSLIGFPVVLIAARRQVVKLPRKA
jgi:hypothetical protein